MGNLAHLQANTFGDGVRRSPRALGRVALRRPRLGPDRARHGSPPGRHCRPDRARQNGRDTAIPSLELVLENPTQIACDTSDCFFVNTISWRSETTPNPTEAHPRIVFERLFGDGGSAAQRAAQTKPPAAFFDSVMQEAARLDKSLGAGDKTKLAEYLDSVREIERRIQHTEAQGHTAMELPTAPPTSARV